MRRAHGVAKAPRTVALDIRTHVAEGPSDISTEQTYRDDANDGDQTQYEAVLREALTHFIADRNILRNRTKGGNGPSH